MRTRLLASVILACAPLAAAAQGATYTVKQLTPETALKAAQSALAKCRADGYQVAVAVVDRHGLTQVLLRDRFAGAHTVEVATNKAWTAVSFRSSTTDLGKASGPNEPSSGIRHFPRVTVVGGGVAIQAQGAQVGGIGVSGAPGGAADEACAMAGIKAIADELEF
jgi:uncharacterized protein GlcG (DUF336 family)